MEPEISKIVENDNILEFTIQGCHVSFVNGIRRTLYSEIPVNAFITEKYEENKCTIIKNTSRFHNEIVKQRLACVPINETNLEMLPGKYILELKMKNDTNMMMDVTTEHFKIKDKESGIYMSQEEVKKIFPPNDITNDYILFLRLRPQITSAIPGEEIDLECEFSTSIAKENSMYNVTSLCSYGNTIDTDKARSKWESIENKMKGEGQTQEEIEFEKRNFYLLDAQREYIENSFDFKLKSIGIYTNKRLIYTSCVALIDKFTKFVETIDGDSVPINIGETTMENSYDIVLEGEDYTMGKLLEHTLYTKYFEKEKQLSYCGFKKFHPHSDDSVIRLSYHMNIDKNHIRGHLKACSNDIIDVYKKIQKMFT